jgi:energy-converting hydrogenase B subunit D
MMAPLQALILAMVALAGLGVVLTRDPLKQAVAVSFYGLLLALMFFVFQAPDVALSQLTIGAVALPLMMLLALAKIRRRDEENNEPRR